MKSSAIRQAFLDYFKQREHQIVASSPLIPGNDPTLLFTNAGMVQFKEVFLGLDKRSYSRATSSQRCVRAGGKHNDLENVGYTARHHTFFEMLGNFSFGDYFKREAIQYAWEFLTDVLGIPSEKLWVTVFNEDDEAADIWLNEMQIDPTRFSRCGEKDNFWSMGDTGPCGPCTEIFYDHGPDIAGGPPGTPEEDGDRYVEIWNLVFMQYDRSVEGVLSPLPKPSVDTGMGLERVAAVLQGVHNNYDIDLFQALITVIGKIAGIKDKSNTSLRVIADHIRSCSFLIIDGVIPSNEGRGYVLRRIIRRAARHGNKLGLHKPFFHKIVAVLVEQMGEAYPELVSKQAYIEKILLQEEEQFARTLDQGLKILEQAIEEMSGNVIDGETVFKLYDTYGFPADLTADIARERNLSIDSEGFQRAMQVQRKQSQAASQFAMAYQEQLDINAETLFTGYEMLEHDAEVLHIFQGEQEVKALAAGEQGAVVLDRSPFYAESGGQVGDAGLLQFKGGKFVVHDTQKHGQAHLHIGELRQGDINVGDKVDALVNSSKRRATMLNHSATHLLHAALRQELGEHVLQKGSLVEAERLRFDFAHYEAMKPEQIRAVERIVNQQIRMNLDVHTDVMTPDQAKQAGAMALFGEKYGDKVRVLTMGKFSMELCGGTHVKHTGDIGFFKITSEAGIAAGVRRIEAITGEVALDWVDQSEQQLGQLASLVKSSREQVTDKVKQALDKTRQLEKQVEKLKAELASSSSVDLAASAKEFNGIKVLATKLVGVEAKTLRDTMDQLKNKLGKSVVVLAAVNEQKLNVVAGVSKDCIGQVPPAGDYVRVICGRGGGREDMAQGGGQLPDDLDERLAKVEAMIEEQLKAKN